MTLARRVIPCLDVAAGRVVKGVSFVNLVDAGDPAELAGIYDAEGADELVFLDITATVEARATLFEAVARTAEQVFIPLTVGGGVRTVDRRPAPAPGRRRQGLGQLGRRPRPGAAVGRGRHLRGPVHGRWPSTPAAVPTATAGRWWSTAAAPPPALTPSPGPRRAPARGAGELLVTSMDADGQKTGYDLDLVHAMTTTVDLPMIASGGAGEVDHFAAAAKAGADAVLAASVFHFGQLSIAEVKAGLAAAGLPVRT